MFAPRNSSPTSIYGKEDITAYEIKLKKVLGLTVCSNAALDCSPISGLLAYPAGCTIVLFNAKKQTQAYLVNTSRKAFTSVTFSRCGRYVATGECGINPAIKVWELEAPNGNLEHCTGGNVIANFVDHKYAVTCVAFSPTGKYLVSVGSQHDMIVNVFDWRANLKVASNKISSKVSAVSFAEDGSYFVTVGNRHVKYWYLEGGRKYKDPIPLMGRSAILGDLRDNDFCAVACGKDSCAESTYAITRQGHLVEFSSRRLLDKWVQCRTTNANCISVNGQFILVGCAEAIIRIFNAATLEYITTLPRTHYLGVDVAQGIHINHIMSVPPKAKYPDCIAMAFDDQRSKVTCVYNDHSLYVWDMRDIKRVGKSHSYLYHSTCIWGVETVPYNIERDISHTLPEDSFVTCSSDDTIRVWGLDDCANNDIYRKNIYSKELLKVIYIDDELNYIKDPEIFGDKNTNMSNSSYDGRNGVRCIKISPELQHLASGDRSGNIRIYNLNNLKLISTIEAHESEVLCLEYSNEKIERKLLASASRDRLIHVFDVVQDYRLLQTLDDHSSSITSIKFVGVGLSFQMISCGADKSIMFRTFQGNIFSRGTHTSGKTTLYDMEVDSNAKHILTACQDRNIRVYSTQNAKHTKTFKGSHSDEGSLIKLGLDPSGIYVATSSTDKTLAVYDYYSNECMARMYGHSELVTGLKFTNDCRHLISASGDGCVFIWQVPHDMIVTMQARLSQQRLRSGHMPVNIPKSIPQPKTPTMAPPDGIVVESASGEIIEDVATYQKYSYPTQYMGEEIALTPDYKLSDVGQLPQWAKKRTISTANQGNCSEKENTINTTNTVLVSNGSISNLSSSPKQTSGVARPRSKWAQRGQTTINNDALTDIRSNSESPIGILSTHNTGSSSVNTGTTIHGSIALGNTQTSDYNSASSKDVMYNQTYLSEDSSIDSGMETRRELKFIGSNNSGTVLSNATNTSGTTSVTNSNLNISGSMSSCGAVGIPGNRKVGTGVNGGNRLISDKRKYNTRFENNSSNDHDGDIEDISDGERTSSEHGMFYSNISPSTPTDFKVTAMNEEELRKSVRRQKFDKSGLAIGSGGSGAGVGNGSTNTTSTGTGTSDTEDEGSTPSAEHADRSLISTLGGSTESIPQTSNSFMQAALPDAPVNIMERGTTGRRSISAKHNIENNKTTNPPTITKSYTSSKKEELLKVINEAKQKLENVGYRSLRGSHSISDLSLAGHLDNGRLPMPVNRYAKTVYNTTHKMPILTYNANTYQLDEALANENNNIIKINNINNNLNNNHFKSNHLNYGKMSDFINIFSSTPHQQSQPQKHFFNCTAPKLIMQENCNTMRQVQQHYPSYPYHVGVHQIYPPPGVPFVNSSTSTDDNDNENNRNEKRHITNTELRVPTKRKLAVNNRRTSSILKHYKSCPVSPVHEESEWSFSESKNNNISENKRHLVYADSARNIFDMIHNDTEKMIAEITEKYGDLDDASSPQHTQLVISKSMPDNLIASQSSSPYDSLGRESYLAYTPDSANSGNGYSCGVVGRSLSPRRVQSVPYVAVAPKHAFSEFYIYKEVYQCEKKVSLSDILNDNCNENNNPVLNTNKGWRFDECDYLEAQRHSSASFFLTSNHKRSYNDRSNESFLSEEFIDEGSFGNSMESIYSDESECISAPLDLQMEPERIVKHDGLRNFIIHGTSGNEFKDPTNEMNVRSYGNSPNIYNSNFDYYMQQKRYSQDNYNRNQLNMSNAGVSSNHLPFGPFDVSNYNLDKIRTLDNKISTEVRNNSEITPRIYSKMNESLNRGANAATSLQKSTLSLKDDSIPRLNAKNKQYNTAIKKSISSNFAANSAKTNKYCHDQQNRLFQRKELVPKPPIPLKPYKLISALTSTVEAEKLKKSLSSQLYTNAKVTTTIAPSATTSRPSKVVPKKDNSMGKLDREYKDIKKSNKCGMRQSASSGALMISNTGGMQSCLKKVSKFDPKIVHRRCGDTLSKPKERPKISVRFNTISQIKYTPIDQHDLEDFCSGTEGETGDAEYNNSIVLPMESLDNKNGDSIQVPLTQQHSMEVDDSEKTFEIFISGNGNDEHDNMTMENAKTYNITEILVNPTQNINISENKCQPDKEAVEKILEDNGKYCKNFFNKQRLQNFWEPTVKNSSPPFSTSRQCENIVQKIDLIQKLITMEEQKVEQIREATENRMRPFECDSKRKGYVKSLTMNFDMLARGIEKDIENEQLRKVTVPSSIDNDDNLCAYTTRIKRNTSLPNVLDSNIECVPERNSFGRKNDHLFINTRGDDGSNQAQKKQHQQQHRQKCDSLLEIDVDGVFVELAKEVKADSDTENIDEKEDTCEKAAEDTGITKNVTPINNIEESSNSSSIRRACSLSDLHMGNMVKGVKLISNPSGIKTSSGAYRNTAATRSANKRNSLQLKGSVSNLNANNTLGTQNQSDSEMEENLRGRIGLNAQSAGRANGVSAFNRSYSNKSLIGNNNRRKNVNSTSFNNVVTQDDSSSEETAVGSVNVKPAVPPRPRNLTFDHKSKLFNSPNLNKQRNSYDSVEFSNLSDGIADPKAQVHNVINKLYTTTQTVLQLHANLKNCDDSLMLKELENAVIMTQNMLTNITQNIKEKCTMQQQQGGGHHNYTITEQTNLENGDYLMMVNNCADLLNNFRLKRDPEDCENDDS